MIFANSIILFLVERLSHTDVLFHAANLPYFLYATPTIETSTDET
jgi:hypothetical protein